MVVCHTHKDLLKNLKGGKNEKDVAYVVCVSIYT